MMEDYRDILDPSLGKETLDKFCTLLPSFLSIINSNKDSNIDVNLYDKYAEMILFLKDKTDREIESLTSAFILRNSGNDLGKILNLPQLLEVIFKWREVSNLTTSQNNKHFPVPGYPKKDDDPGLVYHYDEKFDKIKGVQTPTTGGMLASKLDTSMSIQNDRRDHRVISDGSSDELLGKLGFSKQDIDKGTDL